MGEQRFQAYVEFIEKLLACQRGEEDNIFQMHTDLLDAGLALALRDYIERILLFKKGEEENILFLSEIAMLLELGTHMNYENPAKEEINKILEFIFQLIDLLVESQENVLTGVNILQAKEKVYSHLNNQIHKLNHEFLVFAPDAIKKLFSAAENLNYSMAKIITLLGDILVDFPSFKRCISIEAAIIFYQETLLAFPCEESKNEDCQKLVAMINNSLAVALLQRIQESHSDNIEAAISACLRALMVRTQSKYPEDWATTQNNLALAYVDRIEGDRSENIDIAISIYYSILKVRRQNNLLKDLADTQHNLAIALRSRIKGNRNKNIAQAIALHKKSLLFRTFDVFPTDWADTQNSIGNTYKSYFNDNYDTHLECAIDAYQNALSVYEYKEFPEKWAMVHSNLSVAYSSLTKGVRINNLMNAIAECELALQVYNQEDFLERWAATQNNLASAHAYLCSTPASDDSSFKAAVIAYEFALTVYTPQAFPHACCKAARNLGKLHFRQHNWQFALDAYTTSLAAAESLYQSCILLGSKAAELTETTGLSGITAYAYAKTGELKQALLTLEQGRARGLSECLKRDRTNLTQLQAANEHLYNQYKEITQQISNLESIERDRMTNADRNRITPESLRNEATRLRAELGTTLHQIRQQPGYDTFLTLPTFEDVQKAVTPDSPLTYLFTTLAGSLALVITPDAIHPIWLDDFTEIQLNEILKTWFEAHSNSLSDLQTWLNTIDITTHQLWLPLIGPLIHQLQMKGIDRITLISTGYLSFLPLHAAWIEDESKPSKRRYAFDDIHITYAPNAKSLTAAHAIAQHTESNRVDSILAIDNPRQDLPNSEREITAAVESFGDRAILRHNQATIAAVKAQLPRANIVHFSCHGTAHLHEPLNSGIAMSDGLLTLKDIFTLNLAESGGLRLAILSACETGIQGLENADEAVSLPTGLLQAGVAAVISSLWSVNDFSTRILLTRFYDLWRKDRLEPSVALRQAQLWVRDTSSQQKAKYFQETNPDLFQSLILLPPDYFAHPFHWAAFSYIGV